VRTESLCHTTSASPSPFPPPNQHDDSELHPRVTNFYARLPCLLRPATLTDEVPVSKRGVVDSTANLQKFFRSSKRCRNSYGGGYSLESSPAGKSCSRFRNRNEQQGIASH
jgi:hypothetical protein